MKICTHGLCVLMAALCGLVMSTRSSAQTYLRYVNPEDLGSKALYADTVLTSIRLPQGVASLSSYPKFNLAALELLQVMNDPTKEIMQVYVCGSASPDGVWADNVKLSQARTDAAAKYLTEVLDIPSYKIHSESLNEDWDRLYELVAASDMPQKYSVMTIIKSMDWGERKKALQQLDGGRAWRILLDEFFPQLRCVRFAIFCKWDNTKPYMSKPVGTISYQPIQQPAPASKTDTVYVRDTVYMVKEVVYMPQTETNIQQVSAPVGEPSVMERSPKVWDTPWMMGVKTNLLADGMAIPMGGLEFQIGKNLSFDLQGWYTGYNMFCKEDRNTNIYGLTPEIRFWTKGNTMQRGAFFGLHARMAWYTMQWTDGFLYQNGGENQYGVDAGSSSPAWSAGLTCGYSCSLDRKAHWGLELLLGVGYGNYSQNIGVWNETDGKWYIHEHQNNTHIGVTRIGINLTYRFSVRRVNPEYYVKR